mgnify:CR=1 FL=1
MRLVDLLPKKIKHALYRILHKDKYKSAIDMYHELKKSKDPHHKKMSNDEMMGVAADWARLDHREFYKVFDRKTRYK